MTRTQEMTQFEENTRHKLPPLLASHRTTIDRWLKRELQTVQETIKRLEDAVRSTGDEWARKQLEYFRHGRSWIRTGLKRNGQRRGYGNAR